MSGDDSSAFIGSGDECSDNWVLKGCDSLNIDGFTINANRAGYWVHNNSIGHSWKSDVFSSVNNIVSSLFNLFIDDLTHLLAEVNPDNA